MMMNLKKMTYKRLILYVFGLFFLSLGVSFSIVADLGVSPVSSLAYALTLSVGLSIGITTILTNVIYVTLQVVLQKRIELRAFAVQFLILFLFGLFMDATLFLVKLLPTLESLIPQLLFLTISLFLIAFGLFTYSTARLPLNPYDALTFVIRDRFNMKFSKAKIISDLSNVAVSIVICLIFVHSFGSVRIGTLVSATLIGKIVGWFKTLLYERFVKWAFHFEQHDETKTTLSELISDS